MVQTDYTDKILQYIQKSGQARVASMLQDLNIPRRRVFKILSRQIKSGIIFKEGVHPNIYYKARVLPSKEPAVISRTPISKKAKSGSYETEYLCQELEDARKAQREMKDEVTRLSHELYLSHNELSSKEVDIKYKEAQIHSKEEQIKRMTDREDQRYEENKSLRKDIQDLQIRLREEQRQTGKK